VSRVAGKSTDGIVSRYLNRRLSTPITKFIVRYKIPLTPNQVSLISFSMAVLAFPLYALKQAILAGILVQASSVVDGVDGELARYYGIASSFGAFFDAILDRLADIAVVLGLSICFLYGAEPTVWNILLCMLALSGSLMVSYLHAKTEQNLGVHAKFIGKIWCLASRDVRLFVVFVGSVLNAFFETLLVLAILTNFYVVAKFVEISLVYRKRPRPSAEVS